MFRLLVLGLLSAASTLLAPPALAAGPPGLRIAAASDLRFALEELLTTFRAAHPGVPVEASYGSSGNFFAQIREGAPFDVFLSADSEYTRRLAGEGLGDAPFPYALGRLAVVVSKDSGPRSKGLW
jgi:molybdate transport system substrate-binding protein